MVLQEPKEQQPTAAYRESETSEGVHYVVCQQGNSSKHKKGEVAFSFPIRYSGGT